jgi:Protein of unknown function (DUF1553)/Protein of unknown function (DUF1549)/Planctomycete cytochrome C
MADSPTVVNPRSRFACVVGLLATGLALGWPGIGRAAGPSFSQDIAPLLQARCLKCHSGPRPRAELNLSNRAGLLRGGASGPVVLPGRATDSVLFTRVREKKMPPKDPLSDQEIERLRVWIDAGAPWEGPDLAVRKDTPRVKGNEDWWSFRPIRRPAVPALKNAAWARNPIDVFILSRLEASGLSPAAEADRHAYIRRVTVDLTGLLPTPEEIEEFCLDRSPDAYEKLVDRLLASPAYGERWARHWLDVVRFAESHGYEMNTLRPNAWPYRDYVIRAFNEDRPYAEFVRDQLAGDQSARHDPFTEAATGFLVSGPHDLVGNATVEGMLQQRMDDLADMVSVTGTTFLGLTVGCARCHDHKFDPISQEDFYGLQAVFSGTEHAERPTSGEDDPRRRQKAAVLRSELEHLDRELDQREALAGGPGSPAHRRPVRAERNVERFQPTPARFIRFVVSATTDGAEPCIDELEIYGPGAGNLALASRGARASASSVFPNSAIHRIEHLNDGRVGNSRSWISNERGKGWVQITLPEIVRLDRIVWGRDRRQQYVDRLAREYRIEVSLDGRIWKTVAGSWDRRPVGQDRATRDETANTPAARRRQIVQEVSALEEPPKVYAGTFHAAERTYLLRRGDPMQKGREVQPAGVRAVAPAYCSKPGESEFERREHLADWITSPENPLTDRVLVNRLWQWHFGQGLVRTPSDFGHNGDRPSHPELLDWLASEFRTHGGRLKPLHRLLVLSNTYRQASVADERNRAVDADNRLLWHYAPRRVEAEVIRDAMLQVSGILDRRMGGPGYHLWDYSGYVIVFTPKPVLGPDAFRRMVYQFKPRLQQDRAFGAFDCPDATQPAPRRNISTTPLQALNLLNDPFVVEQSQHFAERLVREEGGEPAAQVRRAFLLAFGRRPSAAEADAAVNLRRAGGLAAVCRALFNANEFLFVD